MPLQGHYRDTAGGVFPVSRQLAKHPSLAVPKASSNDAANVAA
jgi:hypothetical protein